MKSPFVSLKVLLLLTFCLISNQARAFYKSTLEEALHLSIYIPKHVKSREQIKTIFKYRDIKDFQQEQIETDIRRIQKSFDIKIQIQEDGLEVTWGVETVKIDMGTNIISFKGNEIKLSPENPNYLKVRDLVTNASADSNYSTFYRLFIPEARAATDHLIAASLVTFSSWLAGAQFLSSENKDRSCEILKAKYINKLHQINDQCLNKSVKHTLPKLQPDCQKSFKNLKSKSLFKNWVSHCHILSGSSGKRICQIGSEYKYCLDQDK